MKLLSLCLMAVALTGCGVGVEDSEHTVQVSGQVETITRLEIGSCDKFAKNMNQYMTCQDETKKLFESATKLNAMFQALEAEEAQQEGSDDN